MERWRSATAAENKAWRPLWRGSDQAVKSQKDKVNLGTKESEKGEFNKGGIEMDRKHDANEAPGPLLLSDLLIYVFDVGIA